MTRQQLFTLLGLGVAGAVLYEAFNQSTNTDSAVSFSSDPVAAVTEAITSLAGWKNTGSAAQWLPTLAQAETIHGLPADLLARIAYQESHFREAIIRGTQASPAGALGIMQMLPAYFQSVRAPRPYNDAAVSAQIDEAGALMHSLYNQFSDWTLAIAAYNAGAGNVKKYGGIPPFKETQNYVAQVTADVPSLNA